MSSLSSSSSSSSTAMAEAMDLSFLRQIYEETNPSIQWACTPFGKLDPSKRFVNALGVIVNAQHVKPSRGSHKHSLSFTVVDPDSTDASCFATVNWFFNSRASKDASASLAAPGAGNVDFYRLAVGDVVLLQAVKVERQNQRPQLVGNEDKSSLFLFRCKVDYRAGRTLSALRVSLAEAATESEVLPSDLWEKIPPRKLIKPLSLLHVKAVRQIACWGERFLRTQSFASPATRRLHWMRELLGSDGNAVVATTSTNEEYPQTANHAHVDFLCLVLRVIKGHSGLPSSFVVWDGTPFDPRRGLAAASKLSPEDRAAFTATIVQALRESLQFSPPEVVSAEELQTLHRALSADGVALGAPLLVSVADTAMNGAVDRLSVGQWVRVINASVPLWDRPSNAEIILRVETHLMPMHCISRDAFLISSEYVRYLKAAVERTRAQSMARSAQTAQQQATATDTNSVEVLYTLLEIWASPAPCALHSRVSVRGWYPEHVEDFLKKDSEGKVVFFFALRVTDALKSMVVDLVVEDEDAQEFLGCTAASLANDSKAQKMLERQLEALRDSGEEFLVCVKNYLIQSKKRPRQTVNIPLQKQLGLFGTKAPFLNKK